MKKNFLYGALLTAVLGLLMAASSIPQSFSWNSTMNAMTVLMKDGGGTKYLASAKGRTDGVAPSSGMVGEVIENSSFPDTPTNTSTATTVGSITLTPGCWLVSATSYSRGAPTQTGATHSISILNSSPGANAKEIITGTNAATGSHSVTFNNRIVNVSAATPTKTVVISQLATGAAGLGVAYITAIRQP